MSVTLSANGGQTPEYMLDMETAAESKDVTARVNKFLLYMTGNVFVYSSMRICVLLKFIYICSQK